MDKDLLKYRIAKYGETATELANAMGIHETTLSAKINGSAEFKQSEINFIVERYGLSSDDTMAIFFKERVAENSTNAKSTDSTSVKAG